MLTIACPNCRERFGLSSALAGKSFTCPSCKAVTTIPKPEDVYKPGPSLKTTVSIPRTCPRCSRIAHIEPDKAKGWLECPSCSLVFTGVRPPPLPPAPMPLPPESPRDEVEEEADDDELEELRRRRRRAQKWRTHRWILLGGILAGVLLLTTIVLVVRHTSATSASGGSSTTGGSSTARLTTAREILVRFKERGLIDRDVYSPNTRSFDYRPAWILYKDGNGVAVLLEFDTEQDAKAFPVGRSYGRFKIAPYPGVFDAEWYDDYVRQLHRSLP